MKGFILTLILTLGLYQLSAQFHHNLEVGGSNFTGASITTEYQFSLASGSPVYLAPKVGIGHMFYLEDEMTVQTGLALGYRLSEKHAFELNSNASYQFRSPFVKIDLQNYNAPSPLPVRGNIFWYNGVDWRFTPNKLSYILGAGLLTRYAQESFFEDRYQEYWFPEFMFKLGIGI